MTPISPKKRLQKPARRRGDHKIVGKTKLIRFDPSDLQLVERAARSLNPAPTSSYFIVQASVERARRVLGIPA